LKNNSEIIIKIKEGSENLRKIKRENLLKKKSLKYLIENFKVHAECFKIENLK
jgi:hypothetical protein